jgi:hypothetical protein
MSGAGRREDLPVTIRPARPEDRHAILALRERATGDEEDHRALWDWLFTRNPTGSDFYGYVAESDGAILALMGAVVWPLAHAGGETAGFLIIHASTDPDFQGRGLFSRTGRGLHTEMASEWPLAFGFPNQNSGPTYYRKLGWVELLPFPVFVRPLGNIRAAVAERRRRLAPLAGVVDALAPAGLLPARAARRRAERTGARVVALEDFGEWTDELWEELRPSLETCAVRDASLLRWRYFDSPFRYRVYGLDRGSGPIGFAVLSVRPGRLADVMELMVPADDRAGARLLLAHAIEDAYSSGALALRAIFTARHPHRRAFLGHGFAPMPRRFVRQAAHSFGVGVLDQSRVVPNQLLHIDDWYLSGTDLDYI